MSFKLNPFTQQLDYAADTYWGSILGTLSDQADLQAELNAKSDVGHLHVAANITDFDTEVGNHTDVSANTAVRHSHANKALLDTYTQTEVDLADAVLKKHTQNTDTILDEGQANEVTAADLRAHLDLPNAHDASEIDADTTNFDKVLSAADDTVQKALDTLDGEVAILHDKIKIFQPDQSHDYGDYRLLSISGAGTANFSFRIPDDFVSLTSLLVYIIPTTTIGPGENVDINSDYAALGELSTTHSESVIDLPITGIADTIESLDISSVFSNLSAGDFCGFNWKNNNIGTTLSFIAIELKYNSLI